MRPAIQGFPPLVAPDARQLILGSMPGKASLAAERYYAHPRNVFWPIMGELFDAGPALPYEARVARLLAAGIAVWDVMATCERQGSLDADIIPATVRPNDFGAFFAVHRSIETIYFNGAAAEQAFRRLVLPDLPVLGLALVRLPSSSPAHAAVDYLAKLAAWSVIAALPIK